MTGQSKQEKLLMTMMMVTMVSVGLLPTTLPEMFLTRDARCTDPRSQLICTDKIVFKSGNTFDNNILRYCCGYLPPPTHLSWSVSCELMTGVSCGMDCSSQCSQSMSDDTSVPGVSDPLRHLSTPATLLQTRSSSYLQWFANINSRIYFV